CQEQGESLTVSVHLGGGGVQGDSAAFQDRGQWWGGAARQGVHARDQFGEGEGLGEVVVGTDAQTLDLVLHPVGSGQHQDTSGVAVRGQGAGDVVAVGAGQVPVQDDDVVVVDGKVFQGCVAVIDHVHRHGFSTKTHRDGVCQNPFVFDHEYAHVVLLASALEKGGPLPAHPPTHRQRRS